MKKFEFKKSKVNYLRDIVGSAKLSVDYKNAQSVKD